MGCGRLNTVFYCCSAWQFPVAVSSLRLFDLSCGIVGDMGFGLYLCRYARAVCWAQSLPWPS
jgi:hypothetical protein